MLEKCSENFLKTTEYAIVKLICNKKKELYLNTY